MIFILFYLRQMDFSTLPVEALHRYLVQYDLIPVVHPSPLTVHDPPPPSSLLETGRCSSRAASPLAVSTPANRPRRESREQSRRRSSRLLEEEGRRRTPVLADVGEVQNVLARIAQRHFESQVVKEVDSLASFMCTVKGRVSLTVPAPARFHEFA
jgi:Sin3 binding region of histone deacetylase complex subunit SAP30